MSHSPTLVRAGTMRKSIIGSARPSLGVVACSIVSLTGLDNLALGPGLFDVFGYLSRMQQLIEFLDGLVIIISRVPSQHIGERRIISVFNDNRIGDIQAGIQEVVAVNDGRID